MSISPEDPGAHDRATPGGVPQVGSDRVTGRHLPDSDAAFPERPASESEPLVPEPWPD